LEQENYQKPKQKGVKGYAQKVQGIFQKGHLRDNLSHQKPWKAAKGKVRPKQFKEGIKKAVG